MKVLLHEDVPKLGYLGDVVEVKDGYARNYLLPQGVAVEPTDGNIKAIEEERARKAEIRRLAREELVKAAAKVDGAVVTIAELANEQGHLFGSVSEETISAALREKGFEIKSKNVVLPEHFRMLGIYDVTLRFAEDIRVAVKVEVVRPEDQSGDNQPEAASDVESEAPGE